MISENKTCGVFRGVGLQIPLVRGDAAPAACGEKGGVGRGCRSVRAVLDAELLATELQTVSSRGAVAESASVWEPTRCVGWHDRDSLESAHVLQPREKALCVSPGEGSEIGKDPRFKDVKQETKAQGESQAMHVYKKAFSSRESVPK